MPSKTDFQQDKNGLNPPSYNSTNNYTLYRIPPILQLHIKRTWITGLAIDPETLSKEIPKLDPRVEKSEVLRFLNAHIHSEEWEKQREESLNKSYQQMLLDSEKVKELIDQRYDRHFEQIKNLCTEQIDRFAALSNSLNEPLSPKSIQSIKAITSILKDTYLMQRLARGMSQGKFTHEIIQENAEFEEALTLLRQRLDEKIIDAQARVLPAV